ncbi:MAG TPA: AI-2E family transporter [Candidatus Binataceae bacterium]|nr:AI-2E family transporter [Candidatus Binataceae bacterium]
MDRERIIVLFFFGLLALITYQLYAVIAPFITPIVWAILLAFLAHPALVWLNRWIKSRSTCASLITLVVALGVLLPAVWLSATLVREAQSLYAALPQANHQGGLASASTWIRGTRPGAWLDALLTRHGIRLDDEIGYLTTQGVKATSDYIVKHVGSVAGNIVIYFFHFAIALTTFFYLLRDGESYYEALRNLTPLHEEDKTAVFETLRLTLSAVMRGLMLTALLDGFVLGLAYLVLGVPYWELLATLSAAGGLLPIGGTALVWVPVTGYLVFTAGWGPALALIIWAAAALAVIDNFVKPLAMGHGTGLPTVALFFGLAGGIEAYGPLGIFAGPAVIAVFAALLRVYQRVYFHEAAVATEAASPPPAAPQPPSLRQRLKH